jgi:hypothetical protein
MEGSGPKPPASGAPPGALGALNKAWQGHAGGAAPRPVPITPLLAAAAALVLAFPLHSPEVVVSVARKVGPAAE